MSEQRIIEALGEEELLLPELRPEAHGDGLNPVIEIEQMMAAVRQQLTELTAALRSDLEELRRLVSAPPPIRATSVLTASSGFEIGRKFIVKELPPALDGAPPPPRAAPEPFALDRRETTTNGIRRIVCGQIDAAIDDLGAGALEDPGEAVHACRKRFKRVRATARLVRDELGADAYRQENVAFRDFGRRLARARDSQVVAETLDALCRRYASEVPSGAFDRLRTALADDHRAAEQDLNAAAAAPIIAELRVARARVAAWRLRHDAASALAPGFERLHRRGRRAFLAARRDPTDESFHELRKRSKDLWHAAQILRSIAPKVMKTLADRAHRLSDLIGDDHDLAVLAEQVDQRPGRLADEREAALLHALIARRRSQIQHEALELAQRIFTAKPQKLAGPIRRARADTLISLASPAGSRSQGLRSPC